MEEMNRLLTETVREFYAAGFPAADREIAARLPETRPEYPRVAVTVLSYNRHAYLKRTLESLLACCRYPNLYIIALDQGSTDGALYYLIQGEILGRIHEVIALGSNVGPAEGRNRLLDAIPPDIGYVFHLEDDWEFSVAGDWLSPGVELLAERPPIGMVRYRRKPSDHVIATRGDVEYVLDEPYGQVLISQPGQGFTNTPNLGRVADYRRLGRFEDPQHEVRFGRKWAYRWAQFIRVCQHIGQESAFTQADVDEFDGGKRMCSGGVKP